MMIETWRELDAPADPVRPFAAYVADISVVDKEINIRSAVFFHKARVTVVFYRPAPQIRALNIRRPSSSELTLICYWVINLTPASRADRPS